MSAATPQVGDSWYRYDGWADLDGSMEPLEWRVLKVTPRGVWLHESWDVGGKVTKKFVLLNAGKKWAHPSKDDALYSFIRRKQRQIKIMTAQMERVRQELDTAIAFRAKTSSTT